MERQYNLVHLNKHNIIDITKINPQKSKSFKKHIKRLSDHKIMRCDYVIIVDVTMHEYNDIKHILKYKMVADDGCVDKDIIIADQDNYIEMLEGTINKLNNKLSDKEADYDKLFIDCEGKDIIEIIEYAINLDDSSTRNKLHGILTKVSDLKIMIDKKIEELSAERIRYRNLATKCIKYIKKNGGEVITDESPSTRMDSTDIVKSKLSASKQRELLKRNGYGTGNVKYFIYEEDIPDLNPAFSIGLAPKMKGKTIVYAGCFSCKKHYELLCIELATRYNIYKIPGAKIFHQVEFSDIEKVISDYMNKINKEEAENTPDVPVISTV